MDKVQLGRNEALFREVNEAIAATADGLHSDEADFVCECGDPACTQRITAPLDDYERVREDPTRFILEPGHDEPRIERVVRETKDYAVVEKFERTVVGIVRGLNRRP